MRPKFGTVTQVLAGAFILSGVGAGIAGLSAISSDAGNMAILIVLAIGFLAIGCAIWIESLWGWIAGAGLSTLIVVVSVVKTHSPGWVIWAAFLVLFAVSAFEGWQESSS
jgi:hypothetical protein